MTRLRALCLIIIAAVLAGCSGSRPSRGSSRGKSIVATARKQIGIRYKFGGREPSDGFDCSGLALWVHRRHGLKIPSGSSQQFKGGRKVKRSKLRPGDLVFFTTYKKGPSHVGVYTGHGTFIHSPRSGRTVSETSLSNPYWKKRYLGARRYH